MSNKSRLQTNNTNLQALINKANALPEAGGGGGAGVETCTVNIKPMTTSTISYVNNGQIITENIDSSGKTITVIKNTILVINGGWTSMNKTTGSCTKLFYTMSCAAYSITGDCQLVGEAGPVAPV